MDGPVAAVVTRIQSKLPIPEVDPLISITNRRTCAPPARVTPLVRTVVQVCQLPVSGTVSGPVLSAPFTSIWKVPPEPADATRTSKSYVPEATTLTLYRSHSPASTQPTLKPPPALDDDSIS